MECQHYSMIIFHVYAIKRLEIRDAPEFVLYVLEQVVETICDKGSTELPWRMIQKLWIVSIFWGYRFLPSG